MPSTFLCNFDESITGHVLNALVRLVHELEKLIDYRLQEFPMRFQESRILADDVHDVGRHYRFVVLATFHLDEAQKLFDNGDKEAFFRLLV